MNAQSIPGVALVPPDELRTLFLFERLGDERLRWLSRHGERRTHPPGALVFCEGDPAEHLHVLLDGGVRLLQRSSGEDVTLVETTQRGVYAGAVRAFATGADQRYAQSLRTTVASSFFRLPAQDFAVLVREEMPMAVHLLDGLFVGVRVSEATIRRREHLADLGALSAGLAHELNNPAATAVRASAQLRRHVDALRRRAPLVVRTGVDATALERLLHLHGSAGGTSAVPPGDPLAVADAEDAVRDVLAEAGAADPDVAAAAFVAAGFGADDVAVVLEEPTGAAGADLLADVLAVEPLLRDVEAAAAAVSALVASVKEYAHPGAASVRDVDVHAGLDSAVTMLGHKLAGVELHRDYDPSLPRVAARGAELNQVWTNLIDNAVDAVAGRGSVELRTRPGDGVVTVEVRDDGAGIPEELLPRVFEAFFTTKGPGSGCGLGLDTARRIVEDRHHGHLGVTSGPRGTTFTVTLPVHQRLP
ncbi:ATP-binding protein [Paenibacillus sp. TRM 82003]|uniref:ATP-binding protein n=1 Tax=Kineococcus sp. TRM81007 TaxID=2925831 RepID=UPI001F58F7C2|nr:ATP-binding protein [Kineococcus sp. TRM81007]MCI2239447.1 ATP-binding protein [Kineococcus sp. TRM81007]MCI3918817.1 ATP-binding protein [Paenibacillus sp. TRM 82003]